MSSIDQITQTSYGDYGTAPAPEDVYAIFELTAKPGNADALRDLMIPIVAKARTEPGCKHCTLLELESEPNRFFTYEIWTGRAALEAHMAAPHVKELGSHLHPLLATRFKVDFLNAVSPG
ncbi:MAG: antibiotic biosynthesis monooxygenase [Acidobacteriaceae bacterium]|nr:antibiotic biosynthesis monooxygenase [Acidobacteriaceae bacterium]